MRYLFLLLALANGEPPVGTVWAFRGMGNEPGRLWRRIQGAIMDPGEQITGTRDEHYNLISVLYHALQGADTCTTYALDAEAAEDERLAAFFHEAVVVQTQLAERAKGLLGITDGGVAPEPPPGDIAGGISPGDIAGGVPPGDDLPPDEIGRGGPRVG